MLIFKPVANTIFKVDRSSPAFIFAGRTTVNLNTIRRFNGLTVSTDAATTGQTSSPDANNNATCGRLDKVLSFNSTVMAYDGNTRSVLTEMPLINQAPRGAGGYDSGTNLFYAAAASLGDTAYVFGGRQVDTAGLGPVPTSSTTAESDSTKIFSCVGNVISTMSSSVGPATHGFSATTLNGKCYLFGGQTRATWSAIYDGRTNSAYPTSFLLSNISSYDGVTYRSTGSLTTSNAGNCSATMDNYMYVFGGYTTNAGTPGVTTIARVSEFGAAAHANLVTGVYSSGAANVNGSCFIFGGRTTTSSAMTASIQRFDGTTASTFSATLGTAVADHNVSTFGLSTQ